MRRMAFIILTAVFLLTLLPGTASAWCNGPAKNGRAGDGYGSHDWILDQAIKAAGAGGAWVSRTKALLSTDDPDTQSWAPMYHHFVESGSSRGAPQVVSDLYHKAVVAYQAGNMPAASIYLGQLSHCYADILEPFHVTSDANAHKSIHLAYEYAVDDHQHATTKSLSWITHRSVQPVTDVRAETISAALFARAQYPSLFKSYSASHSVTKGTPLKITKALMSRAVNDLADIIRSIPRGTGEAAMPRVEMTLSRTDPRQNQSVGAMVTCVDAAGDPLDGVGVKFVFHYPKGDSTWQTFTDANGTVSHYENIGSSPVGVAVPVTAYVTVSGVITTMTLSFVPRS